MQSTFVVESDEFLKGCNGVNQFDSVERLCLSVACSACGAVTAEAIGLGVSMSAAPILFSMHKSSTP